MKQIRKKNHYVPQVYLGQWAPDGSVPTYRVLVPDENYPEWVDQSLRGIAYREHLYTYVSGDTESDEFERWFDREFEGPAQEAMQLVIREQQLKPEHWRRLVRFALAQDVRTPASLKAFFRRQQKQLKPLMDDTLSRAESFLRLVSQGEASLPERSETPSDLLPFKVSIERQPDGSGLVSAHALVGRKMWLWNIRRTLTETLRKVPRHRWTIVHAPEGLQWPTTDNPLVRLNFNSLDDYNFLGGWGVENGDIFMPLSPKHLLYTSIGGRPWPRGTTLELTLALQLRRFIIEHADRYVFSLDRSEIPEIRPRVVCAQTYKQEEEEWKRWHQEQSDAEVRFGRDKSD